MKKILPDQLEPVSDGCVDPVNLEKNVTFHHANLFFFSDILIVKVLFYNYHLRLKQHAT